MTEETLLTVREVARRCHRTEETVRRWIWSGRLPARKIGNHLFVNERDLSAPLSEVRERGESYGAKVPAATRPRSRKAVAKDLPFTPARRWTDEEADKWFKDVRKFSAELREKYGPFDVTEALRISRGEDE